MELNLKGKVAIVTGASKGIGAGIAKALAAEGIAVTVNYSSSEEGANRVVESIIENGGNAIAVKGDVGQRADIVKLFEQTKTAFGKVDIVINNAAVFKAGPLESITEYEFQREFNINVLGQILVVQEALNYFPKEGGSIINITSVSGDKPTAGFSLYSSTKASVNSLTKSFALELAPRNIRINAVAPGATETEGTHSLGIFGSEMEAAVIRSTPLGRFGQPEDIAKVVVFLSSDAASWITGERITVSGGQ